jgi:signal transduction histidine kinase
MILITSILLFAILADFGLGITVFFTHRTRKVNQSYLVATLFVTSWLIANLLVLHSDTPEQAKLNINISSALSACILSAFQLLRLAIKFPDDTWPTLLKRCSIQLSLNAAVVILCFLPAFTKSVQFTPTDSGIPLAQPQYGPLFIFFLLYMLGSVVALSHNLRRDRKRLLGAQLLELEFLVFACISGASVGLLGTVYAGVTQSSNLVPISNAACAFTLSLIVAYGVTVHRILTVSALLRKATAYALITVFLSIVYFATRFTTQGLCHMLSIRSTFPSQLISTLAVAFSLLPARRSMRRATDLLFSNAAAFDVQATMKKAGTIFQSITTIDALLHKFSDLLCDSLDAENVTILAANNNTYTQRYPKIAPDEGISLSDSDSVVQMMRNTKDLVSKDRLIRTRPTPDIDSAIHQLDQYNINIAAGIFSKGNPSGLVLLGPRRGGRIYDKTEQEALQILCNQLAVALENANLYTEMQDSKIRNDILLDQLLNGVIVASPERHITMINHEAQRITRLSEAATMGRSINLLPKPILQLLETTLSKESGVRNVEATLFSQDEEESISIRMGSTYLFGHDGKPMGALLVFTDLTELKSLEEQVRRSGQLSSVGTLAAGMAHEIKNPLVTIKTFTQLLPERYTDNDFRDDFSSLVALEVSRIDDIVNQLLSFSKPTKPVLTPMNLHDSVEQTLKLIHEQLSQNNIDLKTNMLAVNDLIFGDAKLLSQALVNLSLNAIEAIKQDGTISIETINCTYRFANGPSQDKATTRQCIRFQISDTGHGIDRADLQKIFNPFFTKKSQGTGMGLSISHGIIQEHHSVIEVDSEPGEGTTFYIYIPLLEEGAVA